MSLFKARKSTLPAEKDDVPSKRVLMIRWDPATKLVKAKYQVGRKRMQKTFHAESLAQAQQMMEEMWNTRDE